MHKSHKQQQKPAYVYGSLGKAFEKVMFGHVVLSWKIQAFISRMNLSIEWNGSEDFLPDIKTVIISNKLLSIDFICI